MPDKRDVLEVLRGELAFLDTGGYRKAQRYPWRPNFVFEDSPTCSISTIPTIRSPALNVC